MDLGLKGKTALVSAASQGLGKAVATELSREGATVIICGRDMQKLHSAKAEIKKQTGQDVMTIQADLSISQHRKNLIDQVLDEVGSVDILVTNSGGPPSGKFEDIKSEDWDNAYELLLKNAVDLIKGLLPGMKAKRWGRIISITSQAVKQPVNNLILSNAVRSSVVGLIKTLSNELGEYNITVNNVMPGYTKTERLKSLIDVNPDFAQAIEEIPLKRFGEPEEFAAAVVFLASERASYITGTSLAVDGGWIKGLL